MLRLEKSSLKYAVDVCYVRRCYSVYIVVGSYSDIPSVSSYLEDKIQELVDGRESLLSLPRIYTRWNGAEFIFENHSYIRVVVASENLGAIRPDTIIVDTHVEINREVMDMLSRHERDVYYDLSNVTIRFNTEDFCPSGRIDFDAYCYGVLGEHTDNIDEVTPDDIDSILK